MNRTLRCCLLATSAVLGGTATGWALQMNAPVVQQQPLLDGNVSPEEQGRSAKVTMTVVGGLDKPQFPTTAFTHLTPIGLYVGFICDEPAPDKLIAQVTEENGAVFQDDSVQVFVAPDREANNTNYFHFAVNPRGVKYSTCMEEEAAVEGWTAAATKTKSQWSAELFIPFTSIDARTEVPYWRINLARERPERAGSAKEVSAWINPGASLHNYKRFGFLQIASTIPKAQATPVIGQVATTATLAATGGAGAITATTATVSVTTATVVSTTPTSPTNGGVFFGR